MTSVLVFGKTGQLATGLAHAAWPEGWSVAFAGRAEADLTQPEQVAALIGESKPDIVINAAAYTAVDKAESDIEAARAVNALAPAAMAAACAALDIPFITVSTDYVFDGSKPGEYQASDPVAPLGAYGTSKEEGERLVRQAHGKHVILRTSWVYSAWGGNFVKTMLRYGAERPLMRVVADQHGKPTSAADLAEAVIAAAVKLVAGEGAYGTYHFANDGVTHWHGFATAIFAGAAARGAKVPETIEAITTADYPTPAKRPANSVLSTKTLTTDFGIAPRPWQAALDGVLDELLPPKRT